MPSDFGVLNPVHTVPFLFLDGVGFNVSTRSKNGRARQGMRATATTP